MNSRELIDYWIQNHNEKYFEYLLSEKEPRYSLKSFFLNSFYLFKTFGDDWEPYIEKYQELFRKDPSNDYYGHRNPFDEKEEEKRKNALEWTTLFEIIAIVGFPYNDSAKVKLLKNAHEHLEVAMKHPESIWVDFLLSSAIANLVVEFEYLKDWFPGQISKYIKSSRSPHQYIAYLNALRIYENQNELYEEIIEKLIDWIKSPSGTSRAQILIWARIITRLNWLPIINDDDIHKRIRDNFLKTLDELHGVDWSYSPMVLEAYFQSCKKKERGEILHYISQEITPHSFFKFYDLFPFIVPSDDAMEVKDEVLALNEKCRDASQINCKVCMETKKTDCWVRVLSRITDTSPTIHSGYEIGDTVIYQLQQGIYIIVKAESIKTAKGGGDNLFRECTSLFSNDHALVLYLNPHETAPHIIEEIKKNCSRSVTKPRFEIIPHDYIRQIYRKYKFNEERTKLLAEARKKRSLF
ncbi:MAG: hypothetical protein Q7I98_05110 [Erysipelotrichaceae bacterium]|nr:hypothetical protein [Erysipelotrichaceae bacterium]